MLKIRLQRIGRKNDPSFRVVVTDSRRGPKSARYVETLGSHNPKTKATALKAERITDWIGKGAQVSGTVHNMLITQGIIEGRKVNVLPKKHPIIKKKEEETPVAATEAAEKEEVEATEAVEGERQSEEPQEETKEEPQEEPKPTEEESATGTEEKKE